MKYSYCYIDYTDTMFCYASEREASENSEGKPVREYIRDEKPNGNVILTPIESTKN